MNKLYWVFMTGVIAFVITYLFMTLMPVAMRIYKKRCKVPLVWGMHADPGPAFGKVLGLLPIILGVLMYFHYSNVRHVENPSDKLLPSITQMYNEVKTYVSVPDKRSGNILFFEDTKASLRRLTIGVSASAVIGYVMGILMGLYPGIRALFSTTITMLSNINPLAILVIVLVAMGIGEGSKIFLIVFGIGVTLSRSIQQAVQNIPPEMIVKQETLGATQLAIIFRVVAPQMFPRLVDLVRVSLGAAWIFVIAAEAIASTEGLGYRIYLQQRYMNMALIIPIVGFITTIAFTSDYVLRKVLCLRKFKWYTSGG